MKTFWILLFLFTVTGSAGAQDKPNIVLVLMDNFGWGELGSYGGGIYGVKWRNWKMMFKEIERGAGVPLKEFTFPLFFDLHLDPKEEISLDPRMIENGWIRWPAGQVLVDHAISLKKEPPIRPGTPDPYVPNK